jgi:Fe-S-cluster containining protein
MKPVDKRRLAGVLATAAAGYQEAEVIPHCRQCRNPCCRLDKLVLELEWKQVKVFWKLDESRQAFDRQLASGRGPVEIRAGNGLYYAHQKACPAYDENIPGCRVYGQEIKPVGCSDFPVYEDGGEIVADLRCEAVNLEALSRRLSASFGSGWRIARRADEEFPFLVTLSVRKVPATTGARKHSCE